MKLISHTSLRLALVGLTMIGLAVTSCKKKKEDEVTPAETPTFRGTKIDYNVLTSTTPYNNSYFVNSNGDSTVDRLDGQNRLRMIRAIDAYAKLPNAATSEVDAAVLENMFANVNSPFTGSYADLNSSTLKVREITATSMSTGNRDAVIDMFSFYFTTLDNASASMNDSAFAGQAGRLTAANGTSKYLLDGKGIEFAQIIGKSFIGAAQMDYISNVLLDEGLNADNTQEVSGKKYTALEHNWDVAYGLLTQKSIYAETANSTSSGGEAFLGSYVWEYCRTDGDEIHYSKIHPAFLKGRAAIVNNDMDEVRAQAAIIRNILEKAIARAAVGYMGKWGTGTTNGAKAHAIGEGGGFIYSLRFCTLHGADSAFSDNLISDLGLYTGNGFWDLTPVKVNGVANDIKSKFGIQ